jgi:hypothetical protein
LTHEELLDISERLGRLEVAVAGLDAQLEALEWADLGRSSRPSPAKILDGPGFGRGFVASLARKGPFS